MHLSGSFTRVDRDCTCNYSTTFGGDFVKDSFNGIRTVFLYCLFNTFNKLVCSECVGTSFPCRTCEVDRPVYENGGLSHWNGNRPVVAIGLDGAFAGHHDGQLSPLDGHFLGQRTYSHS